MNNIRDALLRMVEIARESKKASDALKSVGFGNDFMFDLYGLAVDAIWYLIGEDSETFSSSLTFRCVNSDVMPVECCVEMLMDKFKNNFCKNECPFHEPEQPKPNTMDPSDVHSMAKKNGGYMSPEGEWP